MRERVEFSQSFNLIGFGNGRNSSILPTNLGGFVQHLFRAFNIYVKHGGQTSATLLFTPENKRNVDNVEDDD